MGNKPGFQKLRLVADFFGLKVCVCSDTRDTRLNESKKWIAAQARFWREEVVPALFLENFRPEFVASAASQTIGQPMIPIFSCPLAGGFNTFCPMLSRKPWQPEGVLALCASLFASFCFTNIVAWLLHGAHVAGFKNPDDFGFLVLGTLGVQGVAWVLIWVFLKLHETGWPEAFGFRSEHLPKSLLLAAGVLLLTLPVVWLLQGLSVAALARLGVPPENQRAVEMLLAVKSGWARGYFVLFAVVIAPVAEEFIFRGMLYPFIKQLGSPRAALFGVSAIFAGIHLDAGTFVPLFVLALVLTWLYEKTDCLLAPVTAHALFNSVNLVLLHFLPQLDQWLETFSRTPPLT